MAGSIDEACELMADDEPSWRFDPSGRHEKRYFIGDRATELVRDGDHESVDEVGKHELTASQTPQSTNATDTALLATETGEASAPDRGGPQGEPAGETRGRRGRRRVVFAGLGAVAVLAIVAVVVGIIVATSSSGPSVDDKYLSNLRKADELGQFSNDATAVAHGKRVCRDLEKGDEPQGSKADQVAVRSYCKKFLDGFHVLETVTVKGSFTLQDSMPSTFFPSITMMGSSCQGSGGFSDVQPGTTVLVKNGAGKNLTQTQLGPGIGSSTMCLFPFSFELKEGEDQYVVSISRRGDIPFTFAQAKTLGVHLSLGS
jgi:Protein of unknown function (DUF732)